MEDVTALVVQTLQRQLPNIPVYTENMDGGGFSEPSFFVSRVSLTVTPELSGFSMHAYRFDIAYFPDPAQPNNDMDDMTAWLTEHFRTIDQPAQVSHPVEDVTVRPTAYARVREQEYSVVDGVLHLTFRLSFRVVKYEDMNQPTFSGDLDYTGGIADNGNSEDNQSSN